MLKVKNKGVLGRLNRQNLKAQKQRNLIAIGAIVLTTILFAAIFSAVSSINASFQEESFRQVGGYSHAGLKYVDWKLIEQVKDDSMLAEYGTKLFLGMPEEAPFLKSHVEVVYMDETEAKLSYCTPTEGRLPEKADEIATDTRVLQLLGIANEPGQTVTFTYWLDDGQKITDTFTLVGWWEYDPACQASMAIVSREYAEGIVQAFGDERENWIATGSWSFDFMFHNSYDIEGKLEKFLAKYGYQDEAPSQKGYVDTGINWGYTSEKFSQNMDAGTIAMLVVLVLMVYWAGYLIIYNIFRISVGNDIRFYGMLKTIGTTGKQLKAMVRAQAEYLMLVGIPVGTLLGIVFGNLFVPMIMNTMNMQESRSVFSVNPLLLLLAVLLSTFTVLSSCSRPARLAASVSPMEALSYQEEAGTVKKRFNEKRGRISRDGNKNQLFSMAWSNVGRSKGKTVIVILSLSMSVMLLNITIAFTNGFDMDKFTSKFTTTDFVVARAAYFQYHLLLGGGGGSYDMSEELDMLASLEGVDRSGRVYAALDNGYLHFTKEQFRAHANTLVGLMVEDAEAYVDNIWRRWDKDEKGRVLDAVSLYGMEPLALEQLKVVEGDPEKVYDTSGDYIIYVVGEDDYGHAELDNAIFQVGDAVTISYGADRICVDSSTGEPANASTPEEYIYWTQNLENAQEKTYTVVAIAVVPWAISTRVWLGDEQFVLSAKEYQEMVPEPQVMLGLIDAADGWEETLEREISNFTERVNPVFDYESKGKYQEEFYSFKNMFLLIGSSLAGIIGLIGVLNFFNTLMTSVNARKRELAVMQAVGMTTGQMVKMLVYEGILYTGGAVGLSLLLILFTNPLLMRTIGNLFWFITPQFTILPPLVMLPIYLCIGIVIPFILCRQMEKHSVVERLSVVE
ncbi:MAG: ABC transporter permease [Lachnospiraceae bacterium]|nr:ABC transporter permease [Lachnospiraceae bacterium]